MLLELFRWLSSDIQGFNVFNYISLRAVLAVITSLLISCCFGGWFIKKLGEYNLGQYIRDDGPEGHLIKSGTPTMGGGLILISIIISTLLWADLSNSYIWLLLIVTTSFGLIGLIDDISKIRKKKGDGLTAFQKIILQSIIGIGVACYLFYYTAINYWYWCCVLFIFFSWNPSRNRAINPIFQKFKFTFRSINFY